MPCRYSNVSSGESIDKTSARCRRRSRTSQRPTLTRGYAAVRRISRPSMGISSQARGELLIAPNPPNVTLKANHYAIRYTTVENAANYHKLDTENKKNTIGSTYSPGMHQTSKESTIQNGTISLDILTHLNTLWSGSNVPTCRIRKASRRGTSQASRLRQPADPKCLVGPDAGRICTFILFYTHDRLFAFGGESHSWTSRHCDSQVRGN